MRKIRNRPVVSRILAALLMVALVFQTACGTLLHPERRGQTGGRIDPAIAILDGIGLLFFVVPGLIAFAVDFSTGAIYLPPEEGSADGRKRVIHMDPDQITRETLAAAIREHTGAEVTLTEEDMRVLRKPGAGSIDAVLAELNPGPRLAATNSD